MLLRTSSVKYIFYVMCMERKHTRGGHDDIMNIWPIKHYYNNYYNSFNRFSYSGSCLVKAAIINFLLRIKWLILEASNPQRTDLTQQFPSTIKVHSFLQLVVLLVSLVPLLFWFIHKCISRGGGCFQQQKAIKRKTVVSHLAAKEPYISLMNGWRPLMKVFICILRN